MAEGLYTQEDLEEALVALQDGTVGDELSDEVRRVAEIVLQVKGCGD